MRRGGCARSRCLWCWSSQKQKREVKNLAEGQHDFDSHWVWILIRSTTEMQAHMLQTHTPSVVRTHYPAFMSMHTQAHVFKWVFYLLHSICFVSCDIGHYICCIASACATMFICAVPVKSIHRFSLLACEHLPFLLLFFFSIFFFYLLCRWFPGSCAPSNLQRRPATDADVDDNTAILRQLQPQQPASCPPCTWW